MIPSKPTNAPAMAGVPRIRGDDPKLAIANLASLLCSPHTRG
nr:MAG TPA: hypothetical protein [Caudoviricetes sp.]